MVPLQMAFIHIHTHTHTHMDGFIRFCSKKIETNLIYSPLSKYVYSMSIIYNYKVYKVLA